MKNYTIKASILALVLALSGGCDMVRMPKGSMPSENALESTSDLINWKNAQMVRLRDMQGGIYTIVQDLQADQITVTSQQSNHYSGSIAWNTVTTGDYDRADVYIGYYQALDNANYVLTRADKITPTKGKEAAHNEALGTFHFMRAFCYANLALRYGTPYKAESAKTDLCVPLYLASEHLARPGRATNEQVYNQILNVDLPKARELLKGIDGKPMSEDITLDACDALEARIRLYMSDWSGALASAKKLIESGRYPLVKPEQKSFVDMWLHDTSTEVILTSFVSRPDETTWMNPYFGASTDANRKDKSKGVNKPSYLPAQWVVDMYGDNDLRKNVYFEKQECNIKDNFYDFWVISKWKGNPKYTTTPNPAFTFWGGYLPNSMHKPQHFRIAEQYLIAAEAAFKSGDEAAAKQYLNTLRKSRGLSDVTASSSALFEEIKNERTRELAFEGFRLWDLRRWNMPVKRHDPQLAPGGTTDHLRPGIFEAEYKAGDFRFVWPIPANDINTNESVKSQQNPGW